MVNSKKICTLVLSTLLTASLLVSYDRTATEQLPQQEIQVQKPLDTVQKKVVATDKSKEVAVEKPVEQVKEVETLKDDKAILASRSGNVATSGVIMHVRATAYGASVQNGGAGTNVTATGTMPTEGRTIAVDPRMIPLGSMVIIECPTFPSVDGTYIAEDTGGAIKQNRIDIFMHDSKRQRMLEFGIRDVKITVISQK